MLTKVPGCNSQSLFFSLSVVYSMFFFILYILITPIRT